MFNWVSGMSVRIETIGQATTIWTSSIAGNNVIIEYNTFVGLNQLMSLWQEHSHTIEHNIIFGLTGTTSGGTAFLTRAFWPNDTSSTATSNLHMPEIITSDHNGLITPNSSSFQMAYRESSSTVSPAVHYTYSQALATFGFDPHSVIVQNPSPPTSSLIQQVTTTR